MNNFGRRMKDIKVVIIFVIVNVSAIVMCMDPTIQDLLTPSKEFGEVCGYESCPPIKSNMLNVHVVPHTHGELGYTRTFYGHYTGYDDLYDRSQINMKKILDATITELWVNDDRRFTFSDLPYLFHWWANRDSTVRRMVYQLIRQGRLQLVGGGWSMSDEASTSYQAIIAHYTYALRKINSTFLDCGRPSVSWQADVFGHSKEFASLMSQMGFDGLFLNPISFDDELARMGRKDMEFVWRGNDDLGADSDIFTHKLFDGYWSPPGFCFGGMCGDPLLLEFDSLFNNIDERVQVFIEAVKHRQSPHYSTNNIMVIMGQRFGYFDAMVWFENIDRLIKNVNVKTYKDGAKIHLLYSTPACYLKAVHNASPVLHTKQDDFFPYAYDRNTYATGMYTSRPTLKYLAREGFLFLQMSKQLQVLAKLGNNDKTFEELSWIVGVFQDHNIISGSLRIHVKNYYVKKMYIAMQKSTLILKQAFNKLQGSPSNIFYYKCKFNISSCENTNGPRVFIVIYNPLAWPVTIPVRLPILKRRFVVYNPEGEKMNAAIMKIPKPVLNIPLRETTADHELVFIAKDIPPLGYRSYYCEFTISNRRAKKALIKKLNKQNKKYLIRQTNQFKIDDKSMSDDAEYEYFDDVPTSDSETKILFGNFTKNSKSESINSKFNIVTPTTKETSTINFYEETDSDIVDKTVDLEDDLMRVKDIKESKLVEYESRVRINEDKGYNHETVTEDAQEPVTKNFEIFKPKPHHIPKLKTVNKKTKSEEKTKHINYDYIVSNDSFIKNEYITVNISNKTRKICNIYLINGLKMALDIQFYYYISDDPHRTGRLNVKPPGAYIFRALDPNPIPLEDKYEMNVFKNAIVEEIHTKYADFASFVFRLYANSPILELDWVVGPVPVDDAEGKDIFIRYKTDIINNATFYTDSNGRQTVKRIRNMRATYNPIDFDTIAGNIYPVTSKIYIEDLKKNLRFSIFNDRCQGGTSLRDGEVDLMIHRRILTDDSGIQTYLNETYREEGIIVKGKHYLYVSKANYKPNKIFEKKFAKEVELRPQIFASVNNPYGFNSKQTWLGHNNEFSGLNTKLPLGVHLLTLEEWNDDTLLIRLENYLEKSDVPMNTVKIVHLKNVFSNFIIKKVEETTLGADMWLKDFVPLQWKSGKFVENFNEFYGNNVEIKYSEDEGLKAIEEVDLDEGIKLAPQQIRTFVVWYDYVE